MIVYLDHAATTRPHPDVVATFCYHVTRTYGNPSSIHQLGLAAETVLAQALDTMAGSLSCRPEQILLTSCGTESINLAIKGTLWHRAAARRRLIISDGEHAATRETALWMQRQGSQVIRLPLTRQGTVSLEALAAALHEPASLISLIHVSNETGAVNPLPDIVALRDRLQPDTLLHVDAVQTWGKLPLAFDKSGIDLCSGSGHKLGAPKGIGWLLMSERARFDALLHGGGQQRRLRSGTENPPLAAALAHALQLATQNREAEARQATRLRQALIDHLVGLGVPLQVHSPPDGVPQVLSLSLPGLQGETLVNALSAEGICLSTGSACAARKSHGNPVLAAMKLAPDTILSAVRISLSAANSLADMERTAHSMARLHRQLAR